ncbi:MAG: transglycosylase SLT domain-containing protein [Syntrophales bacterium]|nr:transglycosylase SLT domain-containing protein [Syntrophales bacterium]MDD5641227.1 transglycosylase SLT domain-containing protein [Syntrophales bacterium]
MSWGYILLAAVLAACFLAGSATAGVRRYKDSQGIIRISNITPAKPGQIEPPANAAAPAVPEPIQREAARPPETGAPEAAPAMPSPGERRRTAQSTEPATPVVSPEPQSPAPSHPAQENRSIARTPEAEVTPIGLPLRRVAYDPDEPGVAASPPAQVASPQVTKSVTDGDIRHFRNRRGVLVITNVRPAPPQAAPPSWQTAGPAAAGGSIPVEPPDLNGAFPGASGLRPVSWSPDQSPAPTRPAATTAAGATPPRTTGSIRRYRDEHGVIHIENVGATPAKSPNSPGALARVEPQEATAPPASGSSLPEKGAVPPFIGPPDPVPLKEDNPMQILTAAASPQDEIPIQEGIRRYRDRLGIWRIETVDNHWLLEAPPLPRPAASPRQVLLAAAQSAPNLPFIQAAAKVPEAPAVTGMPATSFAPDSPIYAGLATPPNDQGISVTRDRQGRLVITNAPPKTRSDGSQSWMMARAQLDPIIQEAARAYRLPPNLIRAVIKAESNFINAAISPKGAMGLMQLMPGTADFLGVEEPFNPWQNIHGGCRYLRLLIDSFGGSVPLALAGYNAGPQRVVDSGYRVPDIKETQNFLNRVLEWYFSEERKAGRPCT